jgi:hypothetical protein
MTLDSVSGNRPLYCNSQKKRLACEVMESAIFKSKKEALKLMCIINSYSELSLIYEEFWGMRESAVYHAGYFLSFFVNMLTP